MKKIVVYTGLFLLAPTFFAQSADTAVFALQRSTTSFATEESDDDPSRSEWNAEDYQFVISIEKIEKIVDGPEDRPMTPMNDMIRMYAEAVGMRVEAHEDRFNLMCHLFLLAMSIGVVLLLVTKLVLWLSGEKVALETKKKVFLWAFLTISILFATFICGLFVWNHFLNPIP